MEELFNPTFESEEPASANADQCPPNDFLAALVKATSVDCRPLKNITNKIGVIEGVQLDTTERSCGTGMSKNGSSAKKKGKTDKGNFCFPDGGWVCSLCQNYNFYGRLKCNRCGKAKSKEDPEGKPKHLIRKENNENILQAAERPAKKPAGKKTLKERTGDWVCLSCRNLNFAFRKQCNRCKLGRELVGSEINKKPSEIPEAAYVNNQELGFYAEIPLGQTEMDEE